jgi:hypothetical protein
MGPSISESSEIPKRKKMFGGLEIRLLPLFTGQLFLSSAGLLLGDSRNVTESAGLVSLPAAGKGSGLAAGRPNSHSRFSPNDRIEPAGARGLSPI